MLTNTWALVVEADPHNLVVITSLLKELGVLYKRNTTGTNVIPQLRAMQPRPDFILIAMELPEGDPFAICQSIQQDTALAKIPVIALSSQSPQKLYDQLRAAGFSGLIGKPLPRKQFGGMLRHILDGGEGFTLPTKPDL